eukprot:11044120-Karenia_brevis.AAC.1
MARAPLPCHWLRYHVMRYATMSPVPLPWHQPRYHVTGSTTRQLRCHVTSVARMSLARDPSSEGRPC